MLYLIGGVPRGGKSLARKKLLLDHGIQGISLDMIVDMLAKAMPELDINFAVQREVLFVRMWPFIEALIKTRVKDGSRDFVIEGEYFSPERIVPYKDNPNLKACFMIYPQISIEDKITQLRKYSKPKDWYMKVSDEEFRLTVEQWHVRSHMYKGQCEVRDIKFFDTSDDYLKTIDEAVEWMIISNEAKEPVELD